MGLKATQTKTDKRIGTAKETPKGVAHPAADCFPMMPEPRLTELAADIQRNGLLQPIVRFDGKILDGRNRARACELANVEPTFVEWNGENPYRFVWSVNSQRRDLDASQREAIAIIVEREAKKWDHLHGKKDAEEWRRVERERERRKTLSDKAKDRVRDTSGAYKPERITGSTVDSNHAKQRHGDRHTQSPTRRRMEEVGKHDPELLRKVAAGEVKGMEALRQVKRATLGERIAALPAGKFRVVYADPPWKYGDERTGENVRSDSAAADHYPTMSTDKICAFTDENGRHASDLAAGDAVLFMWATFPLLEDALRVIAAWKFNYKTAIVWHKQRSNVGNYHDASCELLMIAVRGSCPIEIDKRVCQMQSIARGAHSAKPEEFRALIDKLYPSGPRVELFRRGTPPDGWTIWGNEATEAA